MTNRIFGSTLIAALMCGASALPAQAQVDIGDFFGAATNLMVLGVEIDRANAEREQANAVMRQQQQQAAEQQAKFNRRVQTALKSLGFYTMAVDGDAGPGTQRALQAYQAAFNVYGVMDELALETLEQHATQGWRSADERDAAAAAGFRDRDSFLKAQAGGFTHASQYEAAQAAGFAEASSFAAFQQSGASDKANYEAQLAEAELATEKAAKCLAGEDWVETLTTCREAANAWPDDAALAVALERALAVAAGRLEENQGLLASKKAELTTLLAAEDGTNESVANALRVEINTLTKTNLLVGLHLQADGCNDLVGQGDWHSAKPACYADAEIETLSGEARDEAEHLIAELAKGRQSAEEGQAAEQARLAEEAARLALEEAVAEANALLDQVNAYVADGRSFEQGVSIARALVTLRSSIGGDDAARITADHAALTELVEADAGFVAARTAMAAAQSQASQTALLVARRQAEVMDAFVIAFIGANVTSENVADLLPVSESLSAALASDNGEVIISAQAAAREKLTALGLTREFAAFEAAYQAPLVSSEAVEEAAIAVADAEAAAANAEQALTTAQADAMALLDQVEVFANSGESLADPIPVARAIARLKAELANPQLGELTTLTGDLAALLEQDTGFVAAMTARKASEGNAMANAIALAREELGTLNNFLLAHIASNLTDDAIVEIVDLQVSVEAALAEPDSAATVQTRDRVLSGLAKLGLEKPAKAYAQSKRSNAIVTDVKTAQNGLSVTPANAALLEGNAGDLLVLRRSDGRAPHLTFNLLGQLHVDGGTALACWAHAAPANPLALLMARRDLRGMGVPNLDLVACDADAAVDLILLRRGDFIAAAPSEAMPVVSAFEQGQLEMLMTIEGSRADAEMAAMAEATQQRAMAIANGTASGFGLIVLPGGSGDICPVVERIEAHMNPLVQRGDSIAFAIATPRLGAPMATEAAFAAAQRGQCSGIYADAATLKTYSDALAKIGVEFTMTPIWVEMAEVDAEVARLAAIEADQIQQAALQRQQDEAAAAVLAAQTADQRTELEKRQAASRAEYQERTDAAHKNIADMVRTMVGTGSSVQLQQWFPQVHDDLAQLAQDRWSLTDLATELLDYGTATWQDRSVDAVLVKVDIRRENALAGVYGHDCFVLGWLVDTEFRINRDAFEATCSDVNALEVWRSGRSYESVWNLTIE